MVESDIQQMHFSLCFSILLCLGEVTGKKTFVFIPRCYSGSKFLYMIDNTGISQSVRDTYGVRFIYLEGRFFWIACCNIFWRCKRILYTLFIPQLVSRVQFSPRFCKTCTASPTTCMRGRIRSKQSESGATSARAGGFSVCKLVLHRIVLLN
jgi:hypothetical protein